MTLIDRLKNAIESKDWTDVIKIYTELGGDGLNSDSEPVKKGRKKKIVEQKYVETITSIPESPIIIQNKPVHIPSRSQTDRQRDSFIASTKGTPKRDTNTGKKIVCRSEPFDVNRAKINIFVDDKTIATADTEFDKKVIVKPPTPRTRQEFTEVDARCVSCGDRAWVHPMFANSYRCDRCSPRISH